MKNMMNACEARAIAKNAKSNSFSYECYIERMSEQIRIAAKEGRDNIIIDVIEYAYHFNMSLNNTGYEHLMNIMINVAKRHRFNCETIICDGEYAFKIS